jgi:oxygen-independent coproporphyrinogen-3 oxidase
MIVEMPSVPGLYIHIPFCKTKCGYCDFFSVTDTGLIDGFLNALSREIDTYREEFAEFDTIYIGGGTPSLLSLAQIEALLVKVRRAYRILPDTEITIEINPADWGRKELGMLRGLGINRISIGVQSFDDNELIFLGRRHNRAHAIRTLEDAINAGFDNISIDLIYGLPGQTFEQWRVSLMDALSFEPAHLSCYELELKPHTPLGIRYEQGEFAIRTEDSQYDFFMKTSEFLEESGYIHYEVSNFSMGMGKASRHNRKYWDHTPYLGLGPSAHSFKKGRRWWNHESVKDYIHDLDALKKPISGSEALTSEQLRMEALFLGLRTRKGIDLGQYRDRNGYNLTEEEGLVLDKLEKTGLIEIKDGFICPTRFGMAVADSLAQLFLKPVKKVIRKRA